MQDPLIPDTGYAVLALHRASDIRDLKLIGQYGQQAMDGGDDEQRYSCLFMDPERHLDQVKA
jgi:hypothetical protein